MLIVVNASDHIQNPEPAKRFKQPAASPRVQLQSGCGHFFAAWEAERLVNEANTFLGWQWVVLAPILYIVGRRAGCLSAAR